MGKFSGDYYTMGIIFRKIAQLAVINDEIIRRGTSSCADDVSLLTKIKEYLVSQYLPANTRPIDKNSLVLTRTGIFPTASATDTVQCFLYLFGFFVVPDDLVLPR